MKIPALITMLLSQGTVTFFTLYFLIQVLRTPPAKPESLEDSPSGASSH